MDAATCVDISMIFLESASTSLKLASNHTIRKFCNIRHVGQGRAAARLGMVVLLLVVMATASLAVALVDFFVSIKDRLIND